MVRRMIPARDPDAPRSHRKLIIGMVLGSLVIALGGTALLFAMTHKATSPEAVCGHIHELVESHPEDVDQLTRILSPEVAGATAIPDQATTSMDDRCHWFFQTYKGQHQNYVAVARCASNAQRATDVALCLQSK